uniref:Small ribosomal subunit protein uS15m n=2 Tax=Oncorhynchus mykiss TaxID=8022 RepID=A0A8C7WBH5_ONCMY
MFRALSVVAGINLALVIMYCLIICLILTRYWEFHHSACEKLYPCHKKEEARYGGPNTNYTNYLTTWMFDIYCLSFFPSVMQSQLSDLPQTMLKMEYAAVPLAQTADDLVKRLLTLELASHSEKLKLKTEQLIAKVWRDEADRSSTEVKVAILTSKIRNYQEHLHKHNKDKANKRWMLMHLRVTHYDAFEHVCQQLGITYTFPPEYYRHATRRWLAKKALCIKVFKEVQKQKLEQRKKIKQTPPPKLAEPAKTAATGTQ